MNSDPSGRSFPYAIVALDIVSHDPRQRAPHPEPDEGEDERPEIARGLLLHYRLPAGGHTRIEPGHLVVVPLRGRPTYGVVVELAATTPVQPTLPITRLVDARPVISAVMLELARWIASYYRCTLWQALAPMLPPGIARRAVTKVGLSDEVVEGEENALLAALGRRQQQVVSLLRDAPRSTLTMSRLKRRYAGAGASLESAIRSLESKGLVTRSTELPGPEHRPQQERIIRLAVAVEEASDAVVASSERAPMQSAALKWLITRSQGAAARPAADGDGPTDGAGDWHRLRDLYLHTGATWATVHALERKGLVEVSERPVLRSPVPPNAGAMHDEPPALTSAQADALNEIARAIRPLAADPRPSEESRARFLLHGVTGSGKTEIYLRAIGMALRQNRQAIVLVPEISLTPQAVHRFASRFPGRVALIHSQLPPGQQFDEWRRIREGHADIVVGSRSAVFAPLPRLGLIVVDEEHEWAYKQDHAPRYHARDVAIKRAELTGSVVILGSATPSLEIYHRAQRGEFRLLTLPARVGQRLRSGVSLVTELPMPPVQVVDMRAELKSGNTSLFSRALQTSLDTALARREQAILYLNRRGSNSFVLCHDCGYVPLCHRCDVPLVYHADVYGMLCHRCNERTPVPHYCAKCGSAQVKGFGTGTQRVVDEVSARFPRARVLRWDRDTASRHGGHQSIMEIFEGGEADILVGTQMIAKGLDIPRVTLVGVINADTGLFLPDFRAPERSMQLLMQVAGRAGRRADTSHSRVIAQTFNPDHYAIQAAASHDYRGFYRGEIRFRAEHGYPPYGQLARLVYSAPDDAECEKQANPVARYLRYKAELVMKDSRLRRMDAEDEGPEQAEKAPPLEIDVIGPAPCFVHKVRGRYRWQALVRASLPGGFGSLFDDFDPGPGWILDIDPLSVL